MDNITVGVYIFVVGMVVLFAALGLLALLMRLLDWMFREKETEPLQAGEPATESAEFEKLAVALAVGTLLLDLEDAEQVDPALGHNLELPRGRFWAA